MDMIGVLSEQRACSFDRMDSETQVLEQRAAVEAPGPVAPDQFRHGRAPVPRLAVGDNWLKHSR